MLSHVQSFAFLIAAGGCLAAAAAPGDQPAMTMQDSTQDSTQDHAAHQQHEWTNRLAEETSPYLLQHAHNPVDWFPWSEEAIALAQRENKPIFLSIGYSTCYWCHVMERESFEVESTAKVMNANYVCIKVDREQRPDVDEIYMTSCQVFTRMTTGRASGGWPLSIFIDPFTLKPFYVGTYFPPEARYGRPSFVQLLEAMSDAWKNRRPEVVEQSNKVAELVERSLEAATLRRALGEPQVRTAVDRLMSMHDRTNGGFGSSPKFPQPVFIELLMEAAWDRPAVAQAIKFTLDRMALGGMYDQVGGGFHRYSVDAEWLVPHFEKMLYDNGQLASAYAASVERTGDGFHAAVVQETLDYVLREMTDPETGAFFSAQDAEVNHHEGENYLWTAEQVTTALNDAGLQADVPLALKAFGLDQGTNFRDPHHPELPPSNVLFLSKHPSELAKQENMTTEELHAFFKRIAAVLYTVRMKRDQPGLDDKVITGWNGLMIKGMADGGRVLEREDYVQAAARAARHIMSTMRDGDGGLMRTARNGVVQIPAFLEDYAFLGRGLLALYEATGDREWLDGAAELIEAARIRFWGEDGAWYDTLEGQGDLFVRARNLGDGAVPSGLGSMVLLVQAMGEATGEDWYLDDFASAMARFSGAYAGNPVGSTYGTIAVSRALKSHPDRLPSDGVAATAPSANPVTARLIPDTVKFDSTGRATIDLVLAINSGFHINAHEPGDSKLIGVQVDVIGAKGVRAEIDYPEGSLYRESIRVHAGAVAIPITLIRSGEVSGNAEVVVRWQACTDQVCHAPMGARMSLRIENE